MITIALTGIGTISVGSTAFIIASVLIFAIIMALIVAGTFGVFAITIGLTLVFIVGLMMLPEILFMLQAGFVDTPAIRQAAVGMYGKDSTYIKDRNENIMKITTSGFNVLSKGFTATTETLTVLITSTTGLLPLFGGNIRDNIGKMGEYLDKMNYQDIINNMLIIPDKPNIYDKIMFGMAIWITYINFYLICLGKGKKILPKVSSINNCLNIN